MTTQPGAQQPTPGMEQVIGKALTEPDFREALMRNPEEPVRSAGIELSADEFQALRSTSREEREKVLLELGERTSPWFYSPSRLIW